MPRQSQIVGVSMVKNEQDIIEPFIRHNMRFLDALMILDNGSQDDTRRIICDVMREIPGIILADNARFAYEQAVLTTRLMHHMQAAWFADFIFFLDADEFIDAPDRVSLTASLATIPASGYGLMRWRTHLPAPDAVAEASADPPRSLRWRRTQELPVTAKAVLHAAGQPCLDHIVVQGNHKLYLRTGVELPHVRLDDVRLLHFPVRSQAQITAKAVVGWTANVAWHPNARDLNLAHQWRDHFDVVCRGEEIGDLALAETALRYAQHRPTIDWAADIEPAEPPVVYDRHFSTGQYSDPLRLIAQAWEASLARRKPLLSLDRPATPEGIEPGPIQAHIDTMWRDFIFVDVPPLRWIVERQRPASAMDLGCGLGAHTRLLRQLGVPEVLGVENLPRYGTVLGEQEFKRFDLHHPIDLGRRYDLVICLDLLSRNHAQLGQVATGSVVRHAAGTIIFATAAPGQPGPAQANRRPIGEWLRDFQALGFTPDLAETLGMRALASLSWLRRNLVVVKRGLTDGEEAIAALEAIAARRFRWSSHSQGIRQEACTEAISPGSGYDVPP